MATHVGALGLAAGAYWLARRNVANTRFTFGSGKFGDLAAFASAIALGLIALAVALESASRLFAPVAIHYASALPVAVLGLGVNLGSALILKGGHAGEHHGHDHNMRAAYTHVLADALTSVLAIAALTAGLLFGLRWLDPAVGIVGALVIGSWAVSLIRNSGLVLLDAEADPRLAQNIRSFAEQELGAHVADLHLWRLGPGHHSLIVSLVSPDEITAERVKQQLRARHPDLSHVIVEVAVCPGCPAP
jgi:cation diffusion facilitator family transporter